MATKVKRFPKECGPKKIKYDWDRWLDGNIWKLKKGTDFNCRVDSMRLYFYTKCRMENLKGKTQLHGDSIWVQAISD